MARKLAFTQRQLSRIVLLWAKYQSYTKVRREFQKEFHVAKYPRLVPSLCAFRSAIARFNETASAKPSSGGGSNKSVRTVENILRVKNAIEEDMTLSVRALSLQLDLKQTTVWEILRKDLKMFPYKAKTTTSLQPRHKLDRIEFARWLLEEPEDFPESIIFTDEKNFEEKTRPNKQNERYWSDVDPEVLDDCRVVGGQKVMCWAAIIDGQVIVHWFEIGERENQHSYLDMLKTTLWPKIRRNVRRYWFQQDGARCHTTNLVLDWLQTKFGERVISGRTQHPWPAKSPDLAPNDYWLWSIILQEIRKVKPASLEELKLVVNNFCESLDPDEVRRAVRHIRRRAEACIQAEGGHFEHKLKKKNNTLDE